MIYEIYYTDGTSRTVTGVETKEMAIEVSKELDPKLQIEKIEEIV